MPIKAEIKKAQRELVKLNKSIADLGDSLNKSSDKVDRAINSVIGFRKACESISIITDNGVEKLSCLFEPPAPAKKAKLVHKIPKKDKSVQTTPNPAPSLES